MVELSPYTWTKITVEFLIDYKSILQKIENLLKLNLKTIVFISRIPPKKPTFVRFFEKIYKIRVVIVFPVLATLIFKYLSFDLT